MSWLAIVKCDDCSDGQDPFGCFDGGETTLGPYDTEAEAKGAAELEIRNVGPWHYFLVEVTCSEG